MGINDLIQEAEMKIASNWVSLDLWVEQKSRSEDMIESVKAEIERLEGYLRMLKERAKGQWRSK